MEVSMAMGVPPNGLFIRGNPIEMDDFGVPLFQETSKSTEHLSTIRPT